ncbi:MULTISPECIES: tRNA1(Val) (adenine(37)-N6)-methyltransferase [Asticcacaulis]|uniref:tRNA1(Val) (adenine(37)-N6)-methyltransferase n=1 Tax=Asticcacaulis TaxID=76890 RepID=UPI001FD9ABBD|nr:MULTISPECIES: methyltransferase [Asticcacaulis]MBP2160927.1 tRNA1(Val) A37 N6-methylase TrmN6 [Asticcacaulis solisilvae]MDR6801869.1 tRNA1(Val) A37 N6-methylase TrmN6 [Asticcacaulis sp. BE141]
MTTESRDDALQSDTSEAFTHLLGQRVKVMQPARGYRIGMDGALLAAACAGAISRRRKPLAALELGCGAGGALLSLKARCPDLDLTGIEREPVYADLARRNVLLNAMHNIAIIESDIGKGYKATFALPGLAGRQHGEGGPPSGSGRGQAVDDKASSHPRFDLVFSNPPYFDDPDTLRPPHEAKRPAWIADDGLGAWLDFALAAVKDGGDIVFIHRADRLSDILSGLSDKAGSFMVRPIQPFAGKDAKRVIVRAKRLGRAPLRLLPPLILHDGGVRKHTDEVEAILAGAGDLSW